jgi:hypothetical protein
MVKIIDMILPNCFSVCAKLIYLICSISLVLEKPCIFNDSIKSIGGDHAIHLNSDIYLFHNCK